jgi:hypothetical protein
VGGVVPFELEQDGCELVMKESGCSLQVAEQGVDVLWREAIMARVEDEVNPGSFSLIFSPHLYKSY